MNECQQKNKCGSGATCLNTIGSFKCQCEDGLIYDEGKCVRDSKFILIYVSTCNCIAKSDILFKILSLFSNHVLICNNINPFSVESCGSTSGEANTLLARGKKKTFNTTNMSSTWCIDVLKKS